MLDREKTKYMENNQNLTKFRKDKLEEMVKIKGHIKGLILEKEKNKMNYLKVLRLKQGEKEKFESLLRDVEKQRYLSLKLCNMGKDMGKAGRTLLRNSMVRLTRPRQISRLFLG
jgi:hypothetical protein